MTKKNSLVDKLLYLFILRKCSCWGGSVFLLFIFGDDELTLTEEFQLLLFNIWLESFVLDEDFPFQLIGTWQRDTRFQLHIQNDNRLLWGRLGTNWMSACSSENPEYGDSAIETTFSIRKGGVFNNKPKGFCLRWIVIQIFTSFWSLLEDKERLSLAIIEKAKTIYS